MLGKELGIALGTLEDDGIELGKELGEALRDGTALILGSALG